MNNISQEDKIAYAEVDYIIHNMSPVYLEKIPSKLVDFFGEVKDQNYEVNLDRSIPLFQNDLKDYTFDLLNVINLNYWTDDLTKKEELKRIMNESANIYKIKNQLDIEEQEVEVIEDTKEEVKKGKNMFLKNIFSRFGKKAKK
jgi:hypothetical protein